MSTVFLAACTVHPRGPVGRLSAAPSVTQTPTGPIVLPPPYATPSARNLPVVGPRPEGAVLRTPPGFRVEPWADGFDEPRTLALAPNGDVFVAEHRADRITVLWDTDGDGRVEGRRVFATGLHQPYGMAFHPDGWLYVANTDGVVRYRYTPGQRAAAGAPERVVELPAGGYNAHWTRSLVFAPDGRTMFVGVGSGTNVSVEADPRRGAIGRYDLDGRNGRIFAGGLRNPAGLAVHPTTGALFAVVNERDELGDDLVPDYLTEVREGAFYGWPYAYFGAHEDPRRRGERPDLVARTVVPDLALGAHVAALGIVFYTGARFPAEYRGDAFVSMHGSWNRARRVGYKVVRVRFREGHATGQVEDFVTGWLTANELIWGRPVGLLQTADGALLIVDDAADRIWRVTAD